MFYRKTVIYDLEKCYSLSSLTVNGKPCLLVAAEKHAPCLLFNLDGQLEDTVWEEPGGVMTMVPIPGRDGLFMATHRFYSPNDSAQAKLITAEKTGGGWVIRDAAELPFVHRFDILERDGVRYVLACTLKSGHEYKNDWRSPGMLWAGLLPDDPTEPLTLSVLRTGMGHNHGYTRYEQDGLASGIVSCDEGVFQVTPPPQRGGSWQVEQLLSCPVSDAVMIDLDGDGRSELFTVSPFHGDTAGIWHLDGSGQYREVYHHPEPMPFLHAICGGTVYGRPTVYVGNREGERLLLGFYFDRQTGTYRYEEVDRGAGAANCMLFMRGGRPALLAANRETNEIAVYDIAP